jgi:methionyl-tRNA formyltransferase
LRVVFAGTPPFAARALEALVEAGHQVSLVLSQPDRPSGRGLKLTPSAVSQTAVRLGIPVAKPASLKDASGAQLIRDAACDVMVVAAYGLLLPQPVLDIPRAGCLNIHASLLPRWRGAAPIQRAILAGDEVTGISIMRMEAGLDTGPVLLKRERPIGARETTRSLTTSLAELGAEAIVEALARVEALEPVPQDPAAVTYAAKILKSEGSIDWALGNDEIDRKIRALDPFPGAEARSGDTPLKIWSAEPVPGDGPPGSWLAHDRLPVVACGRGALRLLEVQRPGSKRMSSEAFARGNPDLFQRPIM